MGDGDIISPDANVPACSLVSIALNKLLNDYMQSAIANRVLQRIERHTMPETKTKRNCESDKFPVKIAGPCSYPRILDNRFTQWLWKHTFCPSGLHLWDEVTSRRDNFLYCDACDAELHLNRNVIEDFESLMPTVPERDICEALRMQCRDLSLARSLRFTKNGVSVVKEVHREISEHPWDFV